MASEPSTLPDAGWHGTPSRAVGTEEDRLRAFRHTRDLVMMRLQHWLAEQGKF